ncbi:MAG: alkaline phosphatase family protein [Candidatus Baltobacteraceae bacterium]
MPTLRTKWVAILKLACAAAAGVLVVACGSIGAFGAGASGSGEAPSTGATQAMGPNAKSAIVLVMENRDYDRVIGNRDAPYINAELVPQAALMTNSHAVGHPSQPNYLALFSGSTQGIKNDSCPHTFSEPNLGAELLAAGESFVGYSESMPSDGFTGCHQPLYARKHNPWVDFTNVPAASNLVYDGFPPTPPTVAFVVPNLCHDMHNCTTAAGDRWLRNHLPPILQYVAASDGLLVITWDEAAPDADGTDHIPTLLIGPMIRPGSYSQHISHYNVLRTIEDIFGVACTANACQAQPLKKMWR